MRTLIFLFLSVLPRLVGAQVSPVSLTVDEAVAAAIKNHPLLSAAIRDMAASQSGVRSARALSNPEIVFSPGITSLAGTDQELVVSQPLEINGTRAARTGVASAQAHSTQAQAVGVLRNVVFETKSDYYELARAQERLSLANDLLKRAEEFDRLARRQVDLGKRPGIDVTQTGIEVARARQQAALALSQVTVALAALNTQMGRTPAAPVGALSFPAFTPDAPDRDALLAQALGKRSEIVVQEAAADEFRQEARLARAQGVPDLSPQFRAGSVTRRFSDYGIALSITLPFLDYGSRRNRIRQAETSAHAQEDRIRAARSQVATEVEQALARFRAAETVLKEYSNGLLSDSERLLKASETGFAEGQTSIVSLLEAQRTYRAVQNEFLNAQADYAIARAELERATGQVPASLLSTAAPQIRRPK